MVGYFDVIDAPVLHHPPILLPVCTLPMFAVRYCSAVACCLVTVGAFAQEVAVHFDRDIRPILSDNCYACHGPDEQSRESELRLDRKEAVVADIEGRIAVVPGRPADSELIRRILSDDPDVVMPPASHRKHLTVAQQQLLVKWVEQGAVWSDQWAWTAPQRHNPPSIQSGHQAANWIDQFIVGRLEREGIAPSAPADRRTLIRRLSFDLLGLPPDVDLVNAFVNDTAPDAWTRLVDSLLQSPRFGERMAVHWLDLVRYADTVGYHGDQNVSVSPYRDYVINAFNANMPFDQFTREQLAGDLLEKPTQQQLIASGYNKLGMMSAEGGVQPKEYLAKYAADRVRTVGSVWLGSTIGCAECHDHKFDPFTTKDFYRFASFFADIKERGLYSGANSDGNWGPYVTVSEPVLDELLPPILKQIESVELVLAASTPELEAAQEQWEADPAATEKLPEEITNVLKVVVAERTAAQREQLAAHYRSIAPLLNAERKQLKELKDQEKGLRAKYSRSSLITVAVERREMRVLPRGNWMDMSGEVVTPAVPGFLPQLAVEGQASRLHLADWMTSDQNPLTARVFVNRLWKLFFGAGISKVLDDVGSQGEPPVHPELLDTLAMEFMDSGWDVKHIIRLMVISATYRQSSLMRDDLLERDPFNRLLARQSRYRLDAEFVRDNALSVSGLLVHKLGGRSAKPYQPAGLYRHLNFPARKYQQDTDENQYRRGVYTHWQRQFLHPAMKSFDAPAREECTAERPRSNTPLAALVMLNDPSYVEAARVLAEQAIRSGGDTDQDRISWLLERSLARLPNDQETEVLVTLLEDQRQHFERHKQDATQLVSTGLHRLPIDLNGVELAAWTSVARTVFNMHEFIARN